MKKVSKVLAAFLPSFFILGMTIAAIPLSSQPQQLEEDSAIYGEGADHVDYYQPDIRNYAEGDDEDEDVTVEVDKVILHYYNENGGNKGNNGRAFYLWVTGVDGKEYNTSSAPSKDDHNPGGIVTVNDDDTMMTIQIDFSTDEFKEFANRSGMYFIIKYAMKSDTDLNWGGQSDDMFIRYADYPQAVNDQKVCELWTMPAAGGGIAILDSEAKTKVHGVALAQFKDWKTIHCTLTSDTTKVNWKLYAYDQTYYKIKPKKRPENQKWYLVKEGTGTGDFDILLKYNAHINMVYSLESHDPSTDTDPDMAALSKIVTVGYDWLYETPEFHKYYEEANEKANLGVTYSKDATTFRVWSPVAANMNVLIYDYDTSSEYAPKPITDDQKKAYDKYQGYHMQYKSGGIWEITVTGADLEGKYYNFQVDNVIGTNVCMDPYATSAGANGIRGLIYDKNSEKVTPTGWNELPTRWDGNTELDIKTPQELSIYEVHIQDFTGDESWVSNHGIKNGTYNAFVEKGTRLAGETGDQFWKKTGFDHLDELGVKAVQIMPTFDHDNNEVATEPKYNWGYNPLNYNIPEGAYSSDPHNGFLRVKEFRNMVLELSKSTQHMRTIMDVVYNHVSSATGSNFHKLMPRYYFRYALKDYTYYWYEDGVRKSSTVSQGELWDGSGCHNEVASERYMMRKFIVDSLCMWARDYKIKGFRFDLMGLIDFQTMNAARKALYEIDPDIYLYGEGWTSGGYHGEGSAEYNEFYGKSFYNYGSYTWQVYNETNKYKQDGVFLGGFNDTFRDSMRGNNDPGTGWIQGGNWVNSEGFRYDLVNNVTAGLWGMNYGVIGNGEPNNGDHTGCYPEQTVNYVSCHDNWTVADQMFQTLLSRSDDSSSYAYVDPNEVTSAIIRASIQAHAITMSSNCAAFILGGEEFLRTKTIPTELHDKITDATSYKEFYGNWVSHNSYNSPLAVNSFKWGNKKSVTFSGIKGNDKFSQTITNAEYNYCDAFKGLIAIHNNMNFKQATKDVKKVEDFTGDLKTRWWSRYKQEDLSNCIAIRNNDVLVFAAVGPIDMSSDTEYLGCDPAEIKSTHFEYGASEWKETYHLFPKNYNFIQVVDYYK